ncbi:hypothetical protein TNCV_4160031 [Trichonephila clavipes]|nr:hypothetical protein TNCV_4160031 [Trichonephila clavipes]
MLTPVPRPAALDYAGDDSWCEQSERYGPTDSRLGLNQVNLLARKNGKLILVLFLSRTHIVSCMAPLIVMQVDVMNLRKTNAHLGVDTARQDRCVLVLIHRAFHKNE